MVLRTRTLVVAISLVTALSMFLAGCVQIEVESEFETDGSGRHSIASTVDRSILDDPMMAGELEGELDFDEIEREAEAAGLEAERIDTADRIGVRISMDVEDNEDLGDVLEQLFSSMDGEAPPVGGFSGGFTQSGGGLSGTTYRFELTVDGDALFPSDEEEIEDELDMDFGMDMMRQFINMTYTVSMPGEITEHNGSDAGPGRVQWNLPFEGSETFIAESEDGSGISMGLIIGGGIGVIALILIVVGGIILMRGQRAPEPVPGPADAPHSEPVHPVTGQPDPVTDVDPPRDRRSSDVDPPA